ncbi:hypothetical protein [Polluticoccus soli]|uniref:hypothetical protein n=1 Tax=Polluticoccus soli TaxID=3034150 RepID=UPI0023E0BB0D|nr:hypothetical protein [Flavipsychrobacter sp. JY13-12]
MMFKKIVFAALAVFGLSPVAYSFNPCLSLLGSYTSTKNYNTVNAGAFDIQNRKVNFGVELTHKFYLVDDLFLRTGFRYNTYKTSFYGKNQIPKLYDSPYPLAWKRGYESYAIPVQLGRDIVVNNSNRGDFYVGFSAGIFNPTSAEDRVSSSLPRDLSFADTIMVSSWDSVNAPSSFFPTIDFGVNYQPFKAAPRFSIGVLCSFQLNKTEPQSFHAVVQNLSTGKEYRYEMEHHQSFINCAVSLSYTFGKPRSIVKKNDRTDCPR